MSRKGTALETTGALWTREEKKEEEGDVQPAQLVELLLHERARRLQVYPYTRIRTDMYTHTRPVFSGLTHTTRRIQQEHFPEKANFLGPALKEECAQVSAEKPRKNDNAAKLKSHQVTRQEREEKREEERERLLRL